MGSRYSEMPETHCPWNTGAVELREPFIIHRKRRGGLAGMIQGGQWSRKSEEQLLLSVVLSILGSSPSQGLTLLLLKDLK
jgi:hypothetical protein